MILYKYLPLSFEENDVISADSIFVKRCHCIKDNKFFFSKPQQLNDPYDCRPSFRLTENLDTIAKILDTMDSDEIDLVLEHFPQCNNKEDVYKFVEKLHYTINDEMFKRLTMWWIQALASKIVEVKMSNIGILSLTEDPLNIVMWAQYAGDHTGACLEVEMPENTHSLRKVCYTDKQPEFQIYEAMAERHGRNLDLFYTKSSCWKAEAEWRMVALRGGEAKAVPGASIRQIIYGIKSSDVVKQKVAEIVGRDIPSRQLKMKRNYALSWD